jgi:hypothetical protein
MFSPAAAWLLPVAFAQAQAAGRSEAAPARAEVAEAAQMLAEAGLVLAPVMAAEPQA